MAHLEKTNFGLWGDTTSTENRVPPSITSCLLLKVPLSLPLWGDVIYGRSLINLVKPSTSLNCKAKLRNHMHIDQVIIKIKKYMYGQLLGTFKMCWN